MVIPANTRDEAVGYLTEELPWRVVVTVDEKRVECGRHEGERSEVLTRAREVSRQSRHHCKKSLSPNRVRGATRPYRECIEDGTGRVWLFTRDTITQYDFCPICGESAPTVCSIGGIDLDEVDELQDSYHPFRLTSLMRGRRLAVDRGIARQGIASVSELCRCMGSEGFSIEEFDGVGGATASKVRSVAREYVAQSTSTTTTI